MKKSRLEAFSDGVIAIIITIMVLELKVPHGATFANLQPALHSFLIYALSFLYIGIYWNNHHHLLQAASVVDGRILWANLHLLFWLSLVPFVSGWMGEHPMAPHPVALYGAVLFMSGVAYYLLERSLIAAHGKNSLLAQAIGKETKGLSSILLYAFSIGLAFMWPVASMVVYLAVAMIWFVPDVRIEKTVRKRKAPEA